MLLSEVTTMRVGGPATSVVEPGTRDELIASALECWGAGEDWLALGGGSNVVVSDDGFDGRVIRIVTKGIERVDAPAVRLRIQAGESWDELVAHTVSQGWAGVEALSGIPGSAGAAPIQNIGAYGQELGDCLVAIEFLDYLTGEATWIPAAELSLGYRTSALKQGRQGIVLAIELTLEESDGAVGYPQLAQSLGVPMGTRLPLASIREGVLGLRRAKGMVLDPADPDSVSCGSFFTNPIVSEGFARSLPAEAPRWRVEPDAADIVVPLGADPARPLAAQPGTVKLSAAWLIEQAGVARGFRLPGSRAAISSKHTLAITNRGGATADEVAQLARFIHSRVLADFGIALQPEPVAVGLQI